jgi:HEAT repeat protein
VLTAWALLAIGAESKTVVPVLASALDDRTLALTKEGPALQAQAANLLGWIGPEAEAAVPVLVRQMLDRDYPVGRSALQALVRIGDPALPELMRALPRAGESGTKRLVLVLKAIGARAVGPLRQTLDHPKAEVRAAAARALGELGRTAQAAVPRLEEALHDPAKTVRLNAAEALLRADRGLNRPALQYLALALKDKDQAHRLDSLHILADLGPRAGAAAPAFGAMISDPDAEVSKQASQALIRLGRGGAAAIPAVRQALGARGASQRRTAIETLERLGAEALDIRLFIGALDDPDVEVRKLAAVALGVCGAGAAEAVPALIRLLADADEDVRRRAVEALGRIGPEARAALPALMTEWQNPRAFDAVAGALCGIGPPAFPFLVPLLQDRKRPNRDKIARVLADLAVAAGSSVWSEVLSDGEPAVRREAMEALERATPAFVRCLGPTLAELVLTERDAAVRRRAVKALQGAGRAATPVLRGLLRDPDADVRTLAAAALIRWPEHAPAAVPVLLAGLKTHSKPAMGCTAPALSEVGRAGKSAVPALQSALQDPDDDVRLWAAIALGYLGPAAREAVPSLRRALRDGDPQVRLAAADAWCRIERRPGEALPILLTALAQGDRTDPSRLGDTVNVTVEPASALHRYGPTAVPALLQGISEENLDLPLPWKGTVGLLKDLGPEAGEAVPSLIMMLRKQPLPILPRPKDLTDNPAERVLWEFIEAGGVLRYPQEEIIEALGSVGPRARDAVPFLIQTLAGKDQAPHGAAAKALGRIGPGAAAAVPALQTALREREPIGASELREVGLAGPNSGMICVNCLFLEANRWSPSDPWEFSLSESFDGAIPSDVRSQAAYALAQIGPAARDAIPALRAALRTRSSAVFPLVYALWSVSGRADWVVPELVDLLGESDTPGEEVFMLLARMGPAAQDAVPGLRHYLADGSRCVFMDPTPSAIQTLGWIGPRARPAIPDLEKLLRSESAERRKSAALALWRIAGTARQAVPVLVKALQGKQPSPSASGKTAEVYPWVRAQAAEALGLIGAEAREAIPALREALHDPDRDLRIAAAAALWRVEGDPATVPPVLLAALRGQDALVPQRALETLGRLGPWARAAIPAIRDLLDDDDIAMRHAAAAALRQIGQEP